jgi:hypothetical protein
MKAAYNPRKKIYTSFKRLLTKNLAIVKFKKLTFPDIEKEVIK